MRKKSDFYFRSFLNKDEGFAAVEISVRKSDEWTDASVKISDCSRQVNLEFDHDQTAKDRRRALKKLELLIGALNDAHTALQKS